MTQKTINRTTLKKDRIHRDILEVAAGLMTERGSSSVSLEEIARHADVARKTLYNHFENKEALIKELVMPLCQHATDYLNRFEEAEAITLDDIWTYCLELWEDVALNLMLLYQISREDCSDMENYKMGFIYVFTRLLKAIPEYRSCSEAAIADLSQIIYRSYTPILQSIGHLEHYQSLFRKGMTGLMTGLQHLNE